LAAYSSPWPLHAAAAIGLRLRSDEEEEEEGAANRVVGSVDAITRMRHAAAVGVRCLMVQQSERERERKSRERDEGKEEGRETA
jgi:hypothetical protein